LGQEALATAHYDKAVRYDPHTGGALIWRGEYHLAMRRHAEALGDLEQSRRKSLLNYRIHKGMASAYAGLGDANMSYAQTLKCISLDCARYRSYRQPLLRRLRLRTGGSGLLHKAQAALHGRVVGVCQHRRSCHSSRQD